MNVCYEKFQLLKQHEGMTHFKKIALVNNHQGKTDNQIPEKQFQYGVCPKGQAVTNEIKPSIDMYALTGNGLPSSFRSQSFCRLV
jgi:hypothetical protein